MAIVAAIVGGMTGFTAFVLAVAFFDMSLGFASFLYFVFGTCAFISIVAVHFLSRLSQRHIPSVETRNVLRGMPGRY